MPKPNRIATIAHRTDFKVPRDIAEAERRKSELVIAINGICTQLSDRNKIDPETGKRLDDVSYHQWRTAAIRAKNAYETEVRLLKEWIREHPVAIGDNTIASIDLSRIDPSNPRDLISAANLIFQSLRLSRRIKFTSEEVEIIRLLGHYLNSEQDDR